MRICDIERQHIVAEEVFEFYVQYNDNMGRKDVWTVSLPFFWVLGSYENVS